MRLRSISVGAAAALAVSLTIAPPSTAQSGASLWLTIANRYRGVAGLDPVVENPVASAGALKHSAYLQRNHIIGHNEDPRDPGYSNEGRRAGLTGDVATGYGGVFNERSVVEGWMTAPFHGIGILGPDWTNFGFGQVSPRSGWAATLSLFWDDDPTVNDAADSPPQPIDAVLAAVKAKDPTVNADDGYEVGWRGANIAVRISKRTFLVESGLVTEVPGGPTPEEALRHGVTPNRRTVVWPGDGAGVPLVRYAGSEYPDPLTSCPGYRSAGLPVYLERGGRATEVASATVVDDRGQSLALCVLSAATFRNPDALAQETGRGVLDSYGAIVLLPKSPLEFGHRYNVTVMTTDGERVAWSFRTTIDEIAPLASSAFAGLPTPGRSSQQPAAVRGTGRTKR